MFVFGSYLVNVWIMLHDSGGFRPVRCWGWLVPPKSDQLYNVFPVEWGVPHPRISGDDSLLVCTLPFFRFMFLHNGKYNSCIFRTLTLGTLAFISPLWIVYLLLRLVLSFAIIFIVYVRLGFNCFISSKWPGQQRQAEVEGTCLGPSSNPNRAQLKKRKKIWVVMASLMIYMNYVITQLIYSI